MDIRNIFKREEIEWEDLGEGVKRRVLAYNDNLMIVEVSFEKGAIGSMHTHEHEQITYVVEGSFELTIDGKVTVLNAGDSTYKEPNVVHGGVALEKTVLLDIFTPMRADFI